MTTTRSRDTIDIENAGNGVSVSMDGRTLLAVAIRGDGAADYRIDGREHDDSPWIQGVLPNLTGAADYSETVETAWNDIRIQCVTGTGTVDDTAEVVLCGARK